MSTDSSSKTPTPEKNFHKVHNEGVGMDQVWEDVKFEYEGSSISVRALATKYGIGRNKINKKRQEENWVKYAPVSSSAKKGTAQSGVHGTILGKTALRKIEEVKEELGEHYSPVDEPLIVMYAKNYERYIDLEQTLSVEGVTLTSSKTGAQYINPLFNALQMTQKTLVTIANQLGLSAISRKTLGIKLKPRGKSEQSIFDFANDINNTTVEI